MLMEQAMFCTTLFVPTDMECELSVLTATPSTVHFAFRR